MDIIITMDIVPMITPITVKAVLAFLRLRFLSPILTKSLILIDYRSFKRLVLIKFYPLFYLLLR